ncbi:Putative peptidase M20, bacterial exopeptidase dimerization domain-containing protein [Septoria linicola]|uniref:Peptidase M20, bacterial exopeptidase dimerization domain-containing protein n=1 Tax=Septoria linicola TaxID=215465 RepID=A0A9Q9EGE7_9PEZI|nr:putative peptidase M20, bacterial exopeptidase dimerization domain-containing protein [Septoria linicola]USW50746.1 Putative peptidase M20, bacterial exopeptidase dimerization domain-containing protein [Septoria linicola]
MASTISQITSKHRPDLRYYEDIYKHFHAHPELSNQEKETSERIVEELKKISPEFDIRPNIGGYGIAALLNNGPGKTVLLRADIDALPIEEKTGLPYASKVRQVSTADGQEKPVMHACGHDMHITCLLIAAHTLVSAREAWTGTLILIFQPAEERGTGARAMVDDGLYDPKKHAVPIPDIVLGAHVVPWRSGTLGTRRGLIATSADSMRITLHGRGGHASMPARLVDPVLMAAHTVVKLQTIVSRETDPLDSAVVTVAGLQAGSVEAENIVVDEARLSVDVRAVNQQTRERALESVRRIVQAESYSLRGTAEPTIEVSRDFPLTINDEAVTKVLEQNFTAHFSSTPPTPSTDGIPNQDQTTANPKANQDGIHYTCSCEKLSGSEDFSILGSSINKPTSFFMYGGTPHELYDQLEKEGKLHEGVPTNHNSKFAPMVQPTMRVGSEGYVVAALGWLVKG